uniref:Egg-white cystatin n=2 Tax=Melopsittacus undulatus TaxID=13146 RepID=A0A8V5FT53_MELUD
MSLPAPPALKQHRRQRAVSCAAMAGAWVCVSLLAVALVLVGSVKIGDELDPLLGAPKDIDNPDNDEGVQKALQFAMTEYNKDNNDLYASRVVRIISAKSQIVSGVKYIMKVEVGRTTCPKTATDVQSCALNEEPDMAKLTTCKFVVYTVPWLNQIKLLESSCQ